MEWEWGKKIWRKETKLSMEMNARTMDNRGLSGIIKGRDAIEEIEIQK